jgi:hypothetical protein
MVAKVNYLAEKEEAEWLLPPLPLALASFESIGAEKNKSDKQPDFLRGHYLVESEVLK